MHLARNSDCPGGDRSYGCPSFGLRADNSPQWGVGKGQSPGAGTFRRWKLAKPLASRDPISAQIPWEQPLRGGAPVVPHARFQLLELRLQDLQNEPFPAWGKATVWRRRGLERTTSDTLGTLAGKAPRPLPRSHPARRGRESPRGSSHPRGFSPVASDFAPGAQPPGAAFRKAGARGAPARLRTQRGKSR